MRAGPRRLTALLAPAALAVGSAGIALAAALAAGAHPRSMVGDIIRFEPAQLPAGVPEERIVVHRAGQFGCVLDLRTIRRDGGSLVVESQLADGGRSFRLHWAGGRTTIDSGDCGVGADLIVDRRDLARLTRAAGNGLISGLFGLR